MHSEDKKPNLSLFAWAWLKNYDSKNPSLGETVVVMQGNLHGGAILLTQAGAFCGPQKGLVKKLSKKVKALIPALGMLLFVVGSVSAVFLWSEQSTNEAIKILTPTPTPTPTPWLKPEQPIPTEIPEKKTQPAQAVKKENPKLITCTGPDGVKFQTTQKECDSLNAAWGNTRPPQQGLTKEQAELMIIKGQGEQALREMGSGNKLTNYNNCLADILGKKNDCQAKCSDTRGWESDACSAAYLGASPLVEYSQQQYDSCISESNAKHQSCYTGCSQQYDPMKCTY